MKAELYTFVYGVYHDSRDKEGFWNPMTQSISRFAVA